MSTLLLTLIVQLRGVIGLLLLLNFIIAVMKHGA